MKCFTTFVKPAENVLPMSLPHVWKRMLNGDGLTLKIDVIEGEIKSPLIKVILISMV